MLEEIVKTKNQNIEPFFEIGISKFYLKSIGTKLDFLEDMMLKIDSLSGINLDSGYSCHIQTMVLQETIDVSERTIDSIQDIARNLIFQTEKIRIENKEILDELAGLADCCECTDSNYL